MRPLLGRIQRIAADIRAVETHADTPHQTMYLIFERNACLYTSFASSSSIKINNVH